MAGKTLVAYVTKGGVTAEYASVIAGVLQDEFGLAVDVVDLVRHPAVDLSPYANILVGTGVRMQRVYSEALTFLQRTTFRGKRVAIFVTSVEPHEIAVKKYIRRIQQRASHVRPIAAEALGGRLQFAGRAAVDHRDLTRVRGWARELGSKFER